LTFDVALAWCNRLAASLPTIALIDELLDERAVVRVPALDSDPFSRLGGF
jgi:hypothetical protein